MRLRLLRRSTSAVLSFGRWALRARGRNAAIAVECFAALAAAYVLLRVRSRRAFRPPAVARRRTAEPAAIASLFASVARKHPFETNCLHRALALRFLLARRGIEADLRIGVGKRPRLLPGHAWIEVGGVVVNDDPEMIGRYEPLHVSEAALEVCYSG